MRESIAELSVRWRYAVAAVASAINATTKGLRKSIHCLFTAYSKSKSATQHALTPLVKPLGLKAPLLPRLHAPL